jgi:hypothetical protein
MDGIAILIFAAVAVLFCCLLAKWIQTAIADSRAPVLNREAVIAELTSRDDTTMTPMGADGAMMPVSSTIYLAKFRFPDGSTEEFKVPQKLWKQMQVGMNGTLTSKGTRFEGFS